MVRPIIAFTILAVLGSPALPAHAAQAPAEHAHRVKPIKPISECMDPANVNEWHVVDSRTLIARTGPKRFLIRTRYECPRLGRYGGGINFRPSNDKQVTLMRMCGDNGEMVSSRDQPPCAVKSIRRIDKREFDRLKAKSERSGSGADQPTRMHHH